MLRSLISNIKYSIFFPSADVTTLQLQRGRGTTQYRLITLFLSTTSCFAYDSPTSLTLLLKMTLCFACYR